MERGAVRGEVKHLTGSLPGDGFEGDGRWQRSAKQFCVILMWLS